MLKRNNGQNNKRSLKKEEFGSENQFNKQQNNNRNSMKEEFGSEQQFQKEQSKQRTNSLNRKQQNK